MKRLLPVFSLLVALRVSAAVHVWTGTASNSFADPANWTGGSPAGDPDAELSFPASARLDAINDLTGLTVKSIAFSGPAITLRGNAINLAADANVSDATAGPNTIACDLVLTGGLTLVNEAADATGLEISGAITGNGTVTKIGAGTVTFSGTAANAYSGGTRVLQGQLRLNKTAGVAAVAGELFVGSRTPIGDGGVVVLADEQIPDSAAIRVGTGGSLRVVARETLGTLVLEDYSSVDGEGVIILAGDVSVPAGKNSSNDVKVHGLLSGTRTLFVADGAPSVTATFGSTSPDTQLVIKGTPNAVEPPMIYVQKAPASVIIENANVNASSVTTAVRLRGGSFRGAVKSLVSEWGVVTQTHSFGGDILLSPATTVRLEDMYAILIAEGTLDLAYATLEPDFDYSTFERGTTRMLVQNDGTGAVRGTFRGLPEGGRAGNRVIVSYHGGDGNDVTMTSIHPYGTRLSLAAQSGSVLPGTAVNLVATLDAFAAGQVPNGGTVVFREDATIIGTATVDASGQASITVTPSSLGTHRYSAEYLGTDTFAPSGDAFAFIGVHAVTPVITSIEPSTVFGGTTVDFVLQGAALLEGGTIDVSSGEIVITQRSDTEIRFKWHLTEQAGTRSVRYRQPGPNAVYSNDVEVLVKALAASPITFETKAVVTPVAVGGGAAWLSVAPGPNPLENVARNAVVTDVDHDGLARWELDGNVPPSGLWVAADLSDGRLVSGRRTGGSPGALLFPFGLFPRDNAGRFSKVVFPRAGRWVVMWVRPLVGAWTLEGQDGDANDLDATTNDTWFFDATKMNPAAGSETSAPAGFEPGDAFMAMPLTGNSWIGELVDTHLRETDDPGYIGFSNVQRSVTESAVAAPFWLMRRDGYAGTVSAKYKTIDGTAIAGQHYVATQGTVTFDSGVGFGQILVPILDDTTYSGNKTFSLLLYDSQGGTVPPNARHQVSMNILDNDPAPRLSVDDTVLEEGESGIRQATMLVHVTGAVRLPINADWRLGSASGTLTFVPGGPTTLPVSMPYSANRTPDEDHTFTLIIGNVQNALPETLQAQLTIVDDDLPEISLLDATASESQDRVIVHYTVTPARAAKPISLNFTTANGSATAGADFTPNGTRAGSAISFPLVHDDVAEGDETFGVALTGATNARIRRGSATVVIVDDDAHELPTISAGPLVVSEQTGDATIHFTLSFVSAQPVTFRATTRDGSATSSDYTPVDRMITFDPGTTEARLAVSIAHDAVAETTEAFHVDLSAATGATIVTPDVTVTVYERVAPPELAAIVCDDVVVVEGDSGSKIARFSLRLAAPIAQPVTLAYATADASAVAPEDYGPASGTVMFAPDHTSNTIDVIVHGDRQYERDETFSLAVGGFLFVGRIVNDDAQPVRRRAAGQ